MDKKLINEDIRNMKYLFGYKPGRVISEQDIDYTTDDYLDIDDSELDEDIFDGWDDPDNFKSVPLHKHHDLEDDEIEIDDLEGFGDDEEEDFEFLPDEDNDHRDEMM
jgi:hypothetical protein